MDSKPFTLWTFVKILALAIAITWVLTMLSGCFHSTFIPQKSTYYDLEPVCDRAIDIVRGDIEDLLKAKGTLIGYIRTNGSPLSSSYVIQQSMEKRTCEHGGTHFLLISNYQSNHRSIINTNCTGYGCFTTSNTVADKNYVWAVFRVEPSMWHYLPTQIVPIGE